MFFELVKKNSRRSRKENGLFFISLIISIAAFYIILSMRNQDVIHFLQTLESDAVRRLFLLVPALYAGSLVILFFLVYFAEKYQLERRSHEFGIYLILGMRRKKLLWMLLIEGLWSSLLSLCVGIPIAVFLSEMISLITAKLVGLGIIGHRFSISLSSIGWTILGYIFIRFTALFILSRHVAGKEVQQLLEESQERKQRRQRYPLLKLLAGSALLVSACTMAISGISWSGTDWMGITLLLGICGVFLLFQGMGILFEIFMKKGTGKNGLAVFTFRQLQETVFHKSNSIAVSSILILLALCCFGYGISVSLHAGGSTPHVMDYTFTGEEEVIRAKLKSHKIEDYLDTFFPVKTGGFFTEDQEHTFSAEALIQATENQKNSREKEILLNRLQYVTSPYLISLSGYNQVLELLGKEPIQMGEGSAALYNDPELSEESTTGLMEEILKQQLFVEMDGETYELEEKFYRDDIVTDRSITISYGLIVSDQVFDRLVGDGCSTYWNARLKADIVEEKGLMQAIIEVNRLLADSGLAYESYLQNMGRQLFYTVAASYTTIYLAIILLIIANTVLGVQYLMQQQKTKKHYLTVKRLGAGEESLRQSARQQIQWHFMVPAGLAAVVSLFGIRSLLTGMVSSSMKEVTGTLLLISVPVIFLLLVIELCYMRGVMHMSDRQISAMMDVKREDS